jgi:hypothetical protein
VKTQLDLFRGRKIAGALIAATLLLPTLAHHAGAAVQDTPISLTSSSWNADVVYATNSPNDTATTFDGGYAWDAAYASLDAWTASSGLPIAPFTNSATNTEFEFQSFTANNVNLFSGGSTGGTLTLTAATAYDNIAILAASANASNHVANVNMTLHFADGSTSSPIPYNIYDWGGYSGATGALPNSVDRSTAGSSPTMASQSVLDTSNLGDFQMYETDFNLASLGYSNKALTSVSFSAPSSGDVGIFALSGYANPTQPPPVQPAAPNSAVPLPATLPLTLTGGAFLALAAMRRRVRSVLR